MPRKELRKLGYGDAKIIFGGHSRMSCRIVDISRHGARLEMPYSDWLPRLFELDFNGLRRSVELVWQGADQIGVRFTDSLPQRRSRQAQFGRRGTTPRGGPSDE